MKEKILFLTAYVPNKAAAGEKNTMIMLNDLASCYDVDLIYFKYDIFLFIDHEILHSGSTSSNLFN